VNAFILTRELKYNTNKLPQNKTDSEKKREDVFEQLPLVKGNRAKLFLKYDERIMNGD
jgi:hypothetical protein